MKVNELFPDWANGGGIMSALWRIGGIPWEEPGTEPMLDTPYAPDLEYHGNFSGDKMVSPLVSHLVNGDGGFNYQDNIIDWIARTLVRMYGTNWARQWATLSIEYNPIENYHMIESMENDETVTEYGKSTTRTDNLTHRKSGTETIDIDETDTRTDNLTHRKTGTETADIDETDTRTDNLTHGKTGTETRTDNLTDTTTPNLTTNTANMVHGFNSTDGVPTGEQVGTETGTNTETHTGTEQKQYNLLETDTGTETTVKDGTNETTFNTTDADTGTQTFLDDGSDTRTRNYELTRSGNIGVTTSQQMIESERTLWVWNFFHDVVFPDIDRVLTLRIY